MKQRSFADAIQMMELDANGDGYWVAAQTRSRAIHIGAWRYLHISADRAVIGIKGTGSEVYVDVEDIEAVSFYTD